VKEAVAAQVRAARPSASTWVSANAGSGKTRVLTDRVARLLLGGTDPACILCLTYTKAAAAEMQTRLFRTLGAWAMLDDPELRAALAALGEPADALPPDRLARARTLFARALETPGGLRIQTIHAFCEALLRRFPLEAGVAPRFAVLEDRQARALREEVLDALAEARPELFDAVAEHLTGEGPDPLLLEILQHRVAFAGPFDPARLARALGLRPGITLATLHDAVLAPGAEDTLRALTPVLAASSPADRRIAECLADALAATAPEARLECLEAALLTMAGVRRSCPTKPVRTAHPGLVARLDDLAGRVEAARPQRLALAALGRSSALDAFARAWLDAFAARKRALGLLDFDDMIDLARALLADTATAAWVLWRLDGGLDHVLVDEAQDTSPAQWRVIEAISAEFFAGAGARDLARTMFVVGDEKQSIYSFQGADPAFFGDMRAYYERLIGELGDALQRCDLLYSFRSAEPILHLVDAVFTGPAGSGLASQRHLAIDPAAPGRVELWPFLPKPDKEPDGPWYEPVDAPPPGDPVGELARRIAGRIAGWLDSRQALPGHEDGRAIRAGDIMILVQRRGPVFHAVIRALKQAKVPVAGADLLRIGGELAVKDLLACLRVAATPRDDLSLAALLRSPLGGLSEEELFDLAHPRAGTLWSALRADARWPEPRALVADLLAQADFLRPFELLQRILIRHGGRGKLGARLGSEAEDGIDALLDQALAYEQVEAPGLTGFLAWIDRDEVAVKRRVEEGADQVRVMTVHGAKGLEAPVVILPDTSARQEGRNPPQILRLDGGEPAWKMNADRSPPALTAAEGRRRALQRAENMRLLYVALTRARTWLIVCGAGTEPRNGESWHGLVREAMAGLGATAEPGEDGDTLVLSHAWTVAPAAAPAVPAAPLALPGWAERRAGQPPAAPPPRSPSGLGGAHVLPGEEATALDEAAAKARGEALHRLLERLHGHPEADWPELAARLLAGEGPGDLLAEAAAVLRAPELAHVFGPGSLAEVDITAALSELGGTRILGRIDRLVVGPGSVLAVDFKSNRAVPDDPAAVPEAILRQMGAYAAALRSVWPGCRVETAILWTRTPRLMPLPGALVAAALARAHLDPPVGRP
jgi:ATP-dependent helicase/nuclease subunit A